MKSKAITQGTSTPSPTIGQVNGRFAAWNLRISRPVNTEQQAGAGKDIDKPVPRRSGIAALVDVIQPGDPATVGVFILHRTAGRIDAHPGIAARLGQRQIDFVGRPLGAAPARLQLQNGWAATTALIFAVCT